MTKIVIPINSVFTSHELTSGSEDRNNTLIPNPYTHPDLGILLSVYHSDYESHSWALSWIMEYLW